jgi:CBS domain-containing protein
MEDDLGKLIEGESLTVRRGEPVGEVIRRMKDKQAGCALMIEGGRVAGIFTEHDMLCKVAGKGEDALRTSIEELMTPNPETLKETDSVAAALNKMSIGRYRNLPVQRNDGSYAVVSIQHVLNYIAQEEW